MRRLSLANSYQIRAFTRRSKHVNFTRKTLLHVFMSYDSIVFANYIVFVPKNLKLGKGPGAKYPTPGFAGGSGGGHGGLGGRSTSQVTTGAAYGSVKEPTEFGR